MALALAWERPTVRRSLDSVLGARAATRPCLDLLRNLPNPRKHDVLQYFTSLDAVFLVPQAIAHQQRVDRWISVCSGHSASTARRSTACGHERLQRLAEDAGRHRGRGSWSDSGGRRERQRRCPCLAVPRQTPQKHRTIGSRPTCS